ncbi:long-chain fatty acid--CoA ligase [Sulfuritalea sp.]|uniref:long-chain fatty acid--CoA ligase n=1 Tax=Sulfuritalea sp. TaxID=2480090 RepID=UPI00286DB075|nr:long-chain fatty acid--CoA ligase [Sulfuritalea sp.]
MSDRHFAHWPKGLPRHMSVPETDLFYNVEVSARRFPNKPYLVFYDTQITFAEFKDEAERIAGWLEKQGVKKGDRVLLYMQNSPQFVLAYYGILRANAVVVPVNPMNMTTELRHYVSDSGATVAIVAQDIYPQMQPLLGAGEGQGLQQILVAAYADYLKAETDLKVPDFVKAPRQALTESGVTLWSDALTQELQPGPITVGPDDLCVMPYTSGTTGHPKGCMHTHRTVMHTMMAGYQWFGIQQDAVYLAVLPFFHVTGMQGSMSGPLQAGSTVVLLPRWDRDAAAQCIARYGVTSLTAIPTMVIDFLMNPKLGDYDLSSISRMSGGGAAMPEAIAQKLLDMGITYVEGYGLSETIAPSHINPPDRAKKQCLGIPIFDVESMVADPNTFTELPTNEVGEILTRGPQMFKGYWNNPEATRNAFVELDGKSWFRTGDLGRVDEDGYFFMVDRLKRMINASGFKVWPAEVEALMYQHPAIQEACVIGAKDPHRGETVKAIVVLKEAQRGKVSEQEIVAWAHANMAAYKSPRIVEFVDSLPKSATGKVMWRALQEKEAAGA